ncbi:unnamed protein product [Caenorhabditis brenneri]
MNLENTTESLRDQLIKFMAEEREEKRREEEADEFAPKFFVGFWLVIIGLVALVVLRFLIPYLWRVWKSRRAGPVTRIPKTPISNENLLEWNPFEWSRSKISKAKVYKNSQRDFSISTSCTQKLIKIMRVVFDLAEYESVDLSNQTQVISIRMEGFSNGTEFHYFEPTDGVIPGTHFTYQIFGEDTIQVTRYVVGNKSYVAGFCIYVKNYSVEYDDISMNVIKKLMKEAEYPGKEVVEEELKEELEKMKAIKWQWKFWKRTSQKCGPKTEQNVMNLENTTECICDQLKKFVAEQMEEKRMKEERRESNEWPEIIIVGFFVIVDLSLLGLLLPTLWHSWKSRRAGPVTSIPKTPISNENLLEDSRNELKRAKVHYDPHSNDANFCTEKLMKIMRVVFNLKEDAVVFLSDTTRVISIRMDGFVNGAEFHSFEPTDGMIPGSHFTYQIFGNNTIQVTRYVVESKSYVAGFCIYVKDDFVGGVDINMNVIKKLMVEEEYPGKESVEEAREKELENKKAGIDNILSKLMLEFWKRIQRCGPKTEQIDMNLETSTQSLCNKLKVIVAKQAKEKRMKENTFITLYLMAFGLAILAALICLLVKLWRLCKSRCAGRVTRIPKTPISKENLLEFNRKEISRARFYYDLKSYRSNCCTKKLEKIWKVVFNLEPPSLLISFTRVISIGMDGFTNGTEFHSFEPADGVIAGSHFTYQIFGRNTIQVTRYVVGKKSYVAGYCIYIKNSLVEDIDININVIKKLMKSARYPGKEAVEKELKDKKTDVPSKLAFWKRSSQERLSIFLYGHYVPFTYGMFAHLIQVNRLLLAVKTMNLENTTECICDQLMKFVAEKMEEKRMKEERWESEKWPVLIFMVIIATMELFFFGVILYNLWHSWKSRRAGPVSRIPKAPISKENLLEDSSNEIKRAKVYYDSQSYDANVSTRKLKEIMRVVFHLREDTQVFLSDTTRVISIRMDGFRNGAEFHDFEPTDGVIPGSHFTYQMFGEDTIQVTRYVVGNKSYLAGFCIYIKNGFVGGVDMNLNVIKKLMKEEEYPGKEAVEEEMKEEMENKKAGKNNILTKFMLKFWKWTSRSGMKTEQYDVPPSYSLLSIA